MVIFANSGFKLYKIHKRFYGSTHKGYLITEESTEKIVWKIGDLNDYFFSIGTSIPLGFLFETTTCETIKYSLNKDELIEIALIEFL